MQIYIYQKNKILLWTVWLCAEKTFNIFYFRHSWTYFGLRIHNFLGHFNYFRIHNLLSFWDHRMAFASLKLCSWMKIHYCWQLGRISLSWAYLPSPFQKLGPLHRRRSDRNEGSVTFHVTMTAEARSLSQIKSQELYLKQN